MLDVAIVGGGICGLALARSLAAKGVSYALFEARDRLGGRVLTVENPTSSLRLDLGPTWFWPQTQGAITRLVGELGLEPFDQHDPGTALLMTDPEKAPAVQSAPGLHGGARRLKGGMAALVAALAADLDPQTLHFGHVLRAARDCGEAVELCFETGEGEVKIVARQVALAVPPRLLDRDVAFAPTLPDFVSVAMRDTPTWMAASAKAVIGLADPPIWRAFGHSGNAFVVHDQAVLGEIFDACGAGAESGALGGFFALPPDTRDAFRSGLPMLAQSQFAQLFGPSLDAGELHLQDWASEPFTCTPADRAAGGAHPDYGARAFSQPLWAGKLFFGSSETAREGGGYVEGAINAAARIARHILPQQETSMTIEDIAGSPAERNARCLELFHEWVASRRAPAFAAYRQRLNFALSHGEREQLTQRAMLGAMEAIFADALSMIDELPFDHAGVAVERGRSDLTPKVQAAFDGFIQALLDAIIDFNRTSCALSNFPDEHKPAKDYVSATLRDIGAAWREFSLEANSRLIAKQCAPVEA
ncbi:FAD-dependent oxidoreductase [Methylocystis sp. JR02]|uniref:flavin monoamine oxidase family protein n=1 Tax=Methylocystis sp. JR02 TaxID=3046284 RepID=UPI0024B9B191|nr:FAD-dependent oxidoreductase [Methylocystis sp. JR02]MDJ0450128.1 FAD-dependent oxidoreductase [Methylocystis sp. JR02]